MPTLTTGELLNGKRCEDELRRFSDHALCRRLAYSTKVLNTVTYELLGTLLDARYPLPRR